MSFLIAISTILTLVWGLLFLQRAGLLVGCTVFLVIGYVFGHQFWSFRLGPIPLTLDRVFLVALVASFVWQWRVGGLRRTPLTGADWLLLLMVGVFAANLLWHGSPDVAFAGTSPEWRLIASYLMPLAIYWIARQASVDQQILRRMMAILAVLGVYLAITAILEVSQQWWAVFPRHIADPTMGTHFGRARGPTLMAASMGVYLTLGLLSMWMYTGGRSRLASLVLVAMTPLFFVAIYFTYTRSTWLGLAAAVLIVVVLRLKGAWRNIVVTAAVACGLLIIAAKWDSILSLKRETSASETRHSVDQRKSFTYVSWKMFQDRPLFGCGFGRFYDRKLPYLSDRQQTIELESLRDLQHHNTFLSVLTETGVIGTIPFVAVLISGAVTAWRLYRSRDVADWVRRYGIFLLAMIATYLASAAFHDLSLSPSAHWMLFLFMGLGTGLLTARSATVGAPQAAIQPCSQPTALPAC